MRFNHAGSYLASSDKSGVIKYFEPNMNNLTAWQGSQSKEAIRGISFSPDDQRFATASDDSSVRIWSFAESRFESVLTGHGWDVKCVEWHPTKGLIVSGSKDSQVKFWDPRTGTCLSTLCVANLLSTNRITNSETDTNTKTPSKPSLGPLTATSSPVPPVTKLSAFSTSAP